MITPQLSFFLASPGKREDVGMHKGLPLSSLCLVPRAHSVTCCFSPSLKTTSDRKSSSSKEIFMFNDSFCCCSSKLKALVSVGRGNTVISLAETHKALVHFQRGDNFTFVSIGRNRTEGILPYSNEE